MDEGSILERIYFIFFLIVFCLISYNLMEITEKIIFYFLEKCNYSIYAIIGIIGIFVDGILFFVWNEKRLGRW